MKRVFLLIGILCVGLFTGFGESGPNARTIMTVVAPKSPAAIPILRMVESNCMGKNVEINLRLYNSTEAMVTLAFRGNYAVMIVPPHTAANLYNKGVNIKVLSVINWGGIYLCTIDPNCSGWDDLEGKEIYVPSKGSVPDILTQYLLDQNNLAVGKNVRIVYSSNAEIAQLIASGRIHYAINVQPYVSSNLKSVKGYRIVSDFAKDWKLTQGKEYSMPSNCAISNSTYLGRNEKLIQNFNRELSNAVEWVVENPEEAGKLANVYLNANAEMITNAMPGFCFKYKSAADAEDDMEKYFTVLYGLKPESIGNKVPDDNLFYIPNKKMKGERE